MMPFEVKKHLDLSVDFETVSSADLKKMTSFSYAMHPTTRVLVQAWAYPGEKPQSVTIAETGPNNLAPEIAAHLKAGGRIRAFNASFEFSIIKYCLGVDIDPEQIICTQQQCMATGLPARLEAAAHFLRLDERKGDSKLMLEMCKPMPARAVKKLGLDPSIDHYWHDVDPERLTPLADYCRQDVVAEQAVAAAVPQLSPYELAVSVVDRRINDLGFRIDRDLAVKMQEIVDQVQNKINARGAEITAHVDDPKKNQVTKVTTQRVRVINFLRREFGDALVVPNLKAPTLKKLLKETPRLHNLSPAACELLELRATGAKSSLAKIGPALLNSDAEGIFRGSLRYAGAGRTMRWSGQKFQPQNLARPTIKYVPLAIDGIAKGLDADQLELFHGPALDVLSSCMRGLIVPRPGKIFVACDLAAIEARVIAWLAGSERVLSWYREKRDVYVETAVSMGLTKAERPLGKVLCLAAGFGMGGPKFKTTCEGYGLQYTEEEATAYVMQWREANPEIAGFWTAMEEAAREAIAVGPGRVIDVGPYIKFTMGTKQLAGCLLMRLPSGRMIVYREARLEPSTRPGFSRDEITYAGPRKNKAAADVADVADVADADADAEDDDDDDANAEETDVFWGRENTYGGKLSENATQAVARDIMTSMLMEINRWQQDIGDVALHIHDEIVVECDADKVDHVKGEIERIMSTPPSWAADLPTACEAKAMSRFGK